MFCFPWQPTRRWRYRQARLIPMRAQPFSSSPRRRCCCSSLAFIMPGTPSRITSLSGNGNHGRLSHPSSRRSNMRVGLPGSGLMGGNLGTLFARAGHEVVFSYQSVGIEIDAQCFALAKKAVPQLAALYPTFQGETTELEADYAPLPPMAINLLSPWPTRHRMSCIARSPGPAGLSSLSPTKSLLPRHEPPPSTWLLCSECWPAPAR